MATNRRNLARLSPAPEIIEWDTNMARVLIEVTARQCQIKWYSLKRGYENLKRLMSDDPDADGVIIRSPHWHDRMFFKDLSDEFWLNGGD